MGYTIGRVFKKEEIVSNVETDQTESVVDDDSNAEQTHDEAVVDSIAEQMNEESTDNITIDASDKAEVPTKTTRRGRKKES